MYKFVIVRHGLSVWSDRFTGWTDIDLAPSGIVETRKYGLKLKELGYSFDLGFTSYLKRGIKTMQIVLEAMGLSDIPVIKAWQLNERHYGALQGLNKPETVAKYGEKQVVIWRRSYDTPPPKLDQSDPRHPANDPVYKDIDPSLLPASECLKDTYNRSVPYFQKMIEPEIKKGKKIITVDPKEEHFSYYRGVTTLTPNHHEARSAVGFAIKDDTSLEKAGKKLLEKFTPFTDKQITDIAEETARLTRNKRNN